MKKKIFIVILVSITCIWQMFGCGKKTEKKEIIYSGSVMLFSNLDVEIVKDIKKEFENTYKGIVLDYFTNESNIISTKVEESFSLDLPEADVIIVDDLELVNRFISNNWLNKYTSSEDKNVNDEFKEKDNNYYVLCSNDDSNYMIMLLSNSLNEDNGKLFVDYLLSKNAQEMLNKKGLKHIRKDIK